jgi:hypothetical protein
LKERDPANVLDQLIGIGRDELGHLQDGRQTAMTRRKDETVYALQITWTRRGDRWRADRAQTIATCPNPLTSISAQKRAEAPGVGSKRGARRKSHAARLLVSEELRQGPGLCQPTCPTAVLAGK